MPIVGRLIGKFDSRKLLASDWWRRLTLCGTFQVQPYGGVGNFWWPLMIQGAALGFVFVRLPHHNNPIPMSAWQCHQHLQPDAEHRRQHGISMVETVQFRNQQKHINILGSTFTRRAVLPSRRWKA